ncbi:hypothetical protein ACFJI0_04230 [Hydrogenophaga sp. UC242_53]|uniref:hypothetical protein n=1 Tax=Hydrogenophaga sp. UC242_53 TaxID=3350170 RepID=UPI0036D40C09
MRNAHGQGQAGHRRPAAAHEGREVQRVGEGQARGQRLEHAAHDAGRVLVGAHREGEVVPREHGLVEPDAQARLLRLGAHQQVHHLGARVQLAVVLDAQFLHADDGQQPALGAQAPQVAKAAAGAPEPVAPAQVGVVVPAAVEVLAAQCDDLGQVGEQGRVQAELQRRGVQPQAARHQPAELLVLGQAGRGRHGAPHIRRFHSAPRAP